MARTQEGHRLDMGRTEAGHVQDVDTDKTGTEEACPVLFGFGALPSPNPGSLADGYTLELQTPTSHPAPHHHMMGRFIRVLLSPSAPHRGCQAEGSRSLSGEFWGLGWRLEDISH